MTFMDDDGMVVILGSQTAPAASEVTEGHITAGMYDQDPIDRSGEHRARLLHIFIT
jgi:hypothetical protein